MLEKITEWFNSLGATALGRLLPFVLILLVGMIVIGTSINPANQNIGSHDRWAGAEVVRKPGR